jgi:hypothetical protein
MKSLIGQLKTFHKRVFMENINDIETTLVDYIIVNEHRESIYQPEYKFHSRFFKEFKFIDMVFFWFGKKNLPEYLHFQIESVSSKRVPSMQTKNKF